MDGDRWDDGDLAAALDANAELGDAVSESCHYHYGHRTDVV
jgi:hypothetical protein